MGAETFYEPCYKPKDVESAFRDLIDSAAWEHGHGGYTGTIAEKTSCTVIKDEHPADLDEAYRIANRLIDNDDPRINDKWGPAGCLKCTDGHMLFFGWASS